MTGSDAVSSHGRTILAPLAAGGAVCVVLAVLGSVLGVSIMMFLADSVEPTIDAVAIVVGAPLLGVRASRPRAAAGDVLRGGADRDLGVREDVELTARGEVEPVGAPGVG